jgi:hypothetical protein
MMIGCISPQNVISSYESTLVSATVMQPKCNLPVCSVGAGGRDPEVSFPPTPAMDATQTGYNLRGCKWNILWCEVCIVS